MFGWTVLVIIGALIVVGGGAVFLMLRKETIQRKEEQAALGLPQEREQLLCFGALMSCRNGEVTRILLQEGRYKASGKCSPDEMRAGLIEAWDINDAQSARSTIQSLIIEGRRAFYDEDFKRMQSGESLDDLKSFDGDSYLRWKGARDAWLKEGLAIEDRHSMAAFDYERIAWLARSCLHVGYITELECWRCHAWVAQQSLREFSSWEAYAASYVMGRAATYSGDDDIDDNIRAVIDLLRENDTWLERPNIWQDYPLKDISVPEELLSLCGDAPSQDALCGFGALMAQGFSEKFESLAIPANEAGANEVWLAESWNVADTAGLVDRLEWFINEGSRNQSSTTFRQVVQGVPLSQIEDVAASQVVNLNFARDTLKKEGFDAKLLSACGSPMAYDLERAAYGARLGLAAGYIDEEKVRSYLRRLAVLAHGSFRSWDEYFVSFVLAQAFFNDGQDYIQRLAHSGKVLGKVISPFGQYQSPWLRFPLAAMPVLQSVKSVKSEVGAV